MEGQDLKTNGVWLEMEGLILKMKLKVKLETFFKKHVYSGGFLMNSKEERFYSYDEASKPFYKV